MRILKLKTTFRENFWGGKIEILSNYNLLCGKIATSCPTYFFDPQCCCQALYDDVGNIHSQNPVCLYRPIHIGP